VSISAHPGKSLFPTYAFNPKNWREAYFRVYGTAGCFKAAVRVEGELDAYERDKVGFLEKNVALDYFRALEQGR